MGPWVGCLIWPLSAPLGSIPSEGSPARRSIVKLAALKASLALWKRRYAARLKLRTQARQDLLEAREMDEHPRRQLIVRTVLREKQAEEALRTDVPAAAYERITHAQDIVLELRTSLDVEAWSGAPALSNLYAFLLTELIGANVARDPERVASCRILVEPLRDAWREAAAAAVAG